MDNLFKTKNKGKTVGYLKIIRGAVWMLNQDTYVKFCNENVTVDYADTTRWALYDYVECPDFDESLPYVCTDKNGENVFVGDKVKSGLRILTIVWNKHDLRWMADEGNYVTPLSQWAIIEQFELIKDKDNG